ncbi:lachesin isoform X2 [Lepeophtheirus salmonis]|nr:lachesin-like [Lepeophtheirus salmonis]
MHRRSSWPKASAYHQEPLGKPYFLSRPTTYKAKIGETVTLSCNIQNLGSSVIVWKQTNRIISAGERLIRKDSRMKLISSDNGIALKIVNIIPEDKGEYICELETFGDPISQKNLIHVLVPPIISVTNSRRNITVRKASTVTLGCNATGFPIPQIIWEREFQMLPSGEKEIQGSELLLANVSRKDSGIYICTASNGVERPVHAKIKLKVIYEPEIVVDKSWVHADVGVEVSISCVVHAEPLSEVIWYRDTMLLQANENRLMEKFGVRHSLVLHSVQSEDFGNYSCLAENSLGRNRKYIEISGHPNKGNITSPNLSYYSDRYNITWSVYSFSRVQGYKIMYRKLVPRDDPSYDTRSRWHNINVSGNKHISIHNEDEILNPLQNGSYMFYALEPSTQYEVFIQCENKWGWSKESDIFIFSTRANDYIPKELASQPGSRSEQEVQSSKIKKKIEIVSKSSDEKSSLQSMEPSKSHTVNAWPFFFLLLTETLILFFSISH